jgi:RHH-type proline utilization regulon transcriptional repressor/proline dehydrogenase/delta 1-pyrroline-5-carboxylate dehydrogenase
MCLAEALLRIPDAETADRLIRDKLAEAHWEAHLGQSESLLVNAATFGLMLTGRLVRLDTQTAASVGERLGRLVARSGEPAIRAALREAMRILAQQFVMGRTIEEALARAHEGENRRYRYSFDMLGEAALTAGHAERYFEQYARAIKAVASYPREAAGVFAAPGVSVKLSALHPRFEHAQRTRLLRELEPRLRALAEQAQAAGIGLTVDAEESERLEVTLDVFEAVYASGALAGYEGLGIAVQAYQKRAMAVIEELAALARAHRRRIPLRLVKGAYWDSEIKRAQQQGLDGYPVFTRKVNTDVSYLACARRVLASPELFYPQFATHNAYTVAAVEELAAEAACPDFEFQRLHGMGESLYAVLLAQPTPPAVRVYAPVGAHADLLPYLVRRLLENGANTSFVNRLEDPEIPIEQLIADPVAQARSLETKSHPRIPLPADLYGPERRNARGVNLANSMALETLAEALQRAASCRYWAAPLLAGQPKSGATRAVTRPADSRQIVGEVVEAKPEDVAQAFTLAARAAHDWAAAGVERRALLLERAADLLESRQAEFIWLLAAEGGRCLSDAIAELREAVDYCRYYAVQARRLFAPIRLPGPTGESNTLSLHGRGVFACISPWNFPLAIFLGQITAALAAGNAVVAKPARQTPLVAMRAVQVLLEAGVPPEVLHLLPGSSEVIGEALLAEPHLAGVVLTGSTATARAIQAQLARRAGPILPFIAETGGVNAMIADSSALPEQLVADVLVSAFNSAGQRCSALRVLFLQEEIAETVIEMLAGAMAELRLGDPLRLSTDVGPVIDRAAQERLEAYIDSLRRRARLIAETPAPDGEATRHGCFVRPIAFEVGREALPCQEIFGPVLHVARFAAGELDRLVDIINATGFGLTLGVHSRLESTIERVRRRARVGNLYVNRNMIGAVVGVQPFGGEGLSGTGPKAGGPHYLLRFATERTLTVNTAAVGGNASLLSLGDDDTWT